MDRLPISPLSLNQLTRDTWDSYDARAIAQLAGLAHDDCYRVKFYKAPQDDLELVPSTRFASYGMRIPTGSLILGWCSPYTGITPVNSIPTVQITDLNIHVNGQPHKWFNMGVPALFLSSQKWEALSSAPASPALISAFPNLLPAPYPVTGAGLFQVDIQSTGLVQRIEIVFLCLEVCAK